MAKNDLAYFYYFVLIKFQLTYLSLGNYFWAYAHVATKQNLSLLESIKFGEIKLITKFIYTFIMFATNNH